MKPMKRFLRYAFHTQTEISVKSCSFSESISNLQLFLMKSRWQAAEWNQAERSQSLWRRLHTHSPHTRSNTWLQMLMSKFCFWVFLCLDILKILLGHLIDLKDSFWQTCFTKKNPTTEEKSESRRFRRGSRVRARKRAAAFQATTHLSST